MASFMPHFSEAVPFKNLYNLCWSSWWQVWHGTGLLDEEYLKLSQNGLSGRDAPRGGEAFIMEQLDVTLRCFKDVIDGFLERVAIAHAAR